MIGFLIQNPPFLIILFINTRCFPLRRALSLGTRPTRCWSQKRCHRTWRFYLLFPALSLVRFPVESPSSLQTTNIVLAQIILKINSINYLSFNATIPGNSLPSINSNDAPPPVEIWSILDATSNFSTAAAESPPPIIV